MVKNIIIIVLFFLSVNSVYATDDCYAWITKRDTNIISNVLYPRVTIGVQNNGISNNDRVIIKSSTFKAEQFICESAYTANITNPYAPYCELTTGNLPENSYTRPIITYSGEDTGLYPANTTTRLPSTVDDPFSDWSNGVNLGAVDGAFADVNNASPIKYEGVKDFATWDIPDRATISAITVEVKGYATGDFTARHVGVNLSRDGFITRQYNGVDNDLLWLNLPATSTVHTYTTDDTKSNFRAYNWLPEDFNSGNFGIAIYADQGNSHHFYIDYVSVFVTYKMLDPSHFDAYISDGVTDTLCDISSMGTLTPVYSYGSGGSSSGQLINPEAGAVVLIPAMCSTFDYFCQFKQFIYNLAMAFFGIDPDYATARYNLFIDEFADKIPFAYINAITDNFNLITPVASTAASEFPDFNIAFTPKYKIGGTMTDLTPVELNVASSTFDNFKPQQAWLYTFWKAVIGIMWGIYMMRLFHRMFK